MKIKQTIPYPTYTTTQRNNLTLNVDYVENYIIYNNTESQYEYFDGSNWQPYAMNVIDNEILYFNATIGTGGDYPSTGITNDIQTAITAGKLRLKLISDITLQQDINIDNSVIIDLNKHTITTGEFGFKYNSGSLNIFNGGITLNYTSANTVFDENFDRITLISSSIEYNSSSSIPSGYISRDGFFLNCYVTASNGAYSCFGYNTSDTFFRGILQNITITGGGTSCYYMIRANSDALIKDITLKGSYTTSMGAVILCAYASGIYNNITAGNCNLHGSFDTVKKYGNRPIYIQAPPNATKPNINCDFDYIPYGGCFVGCTCTNSSFVAGGGTYINAYIFRDTYFPDNLTLSNVRKYDVQGCTIIGNVTAGTSSYDSVFKNNEVGGSFDATTTTKTSDFTGNIINGNITITGDNCNCGFISRGTLSIDGDNNIITGCQVTGATTLSLGSEENIITGNHFDGGFTNSSGEINNIIKNNIT